MSSGAGGNDPDWKDGLKKVIDSLLKESEAIEKNASDAKYRNSVSNISKVLLEKIGKSNISPRIPKLPGSTPNTGKTKHSYYLN